VTVIEGLGTKLYLPRFYFWWAEGLLLADRVREALEAAEKALALATELGERGNEGHALRLLGDIAAAGAPPDFLAAESFYERSRVLATELGMRPLVVHCHLYRNRFTNVDRLLNRPRNSPAPLPSPARTPYPSRGTSSSQW